MLNKKLLLSAGAAVAAFAAMPASAATCVGNCGTAGADGDVVLSPTGNSEYSYVSTWNGSATTAGEIAGVGDGDAGVNTGSQFTTAAFSASAGDSLTFFFNYITSDGSGFADYGWAQLLDSSGSNAGWLFTGRTQPDGDIAPGFGLPALDAALTPLTSEIIDGETTWSPLGGDSGRCFSGVGQGCGQTGWIESSFTIAADGMYSVAFGVTNFNDSQFASGLAWDGLELNDTPIDGGDVGGAIPEPTTWALMLLGFFGIGGFMRRRSNVTTKVSFA